MKKQHPVIKMSSIRRYTKSKKRFAKIKKRHESSSMSKKRKSNDQASFISNISTSHHSKQNLHNSKSQTRKSQNGKFLRPSSALTISNMKSQMRKKASNRNDGHKKISHQSFTDNTFDLGSSKQALSKLSIRGNSKKKSR